ncbi:MAG: hypothetical protein ACLGIA_09815 [Actinomycetes bacterium]
MHARRTVLAAAVLLALAGCGGGGSGTGTATGSPSISAPKAQTSPSAGMSSSGASGSVAASEVSVSTASTSLGTILVDGKGMTLYMFDPDKQGASTCYDQCAQAWPPLTAQGQAKAGEGVDQSLLGVVQRKDGTEQVTYNKWPLYTWVSDKSPGEVTGQGVQGVWWVLDAKGEPVGHHQ